MLIEVSLILFALFAVCTTVYLYQVTKRIRQINNELRTQNDINSSEFDALYSREYNKAEDFRSITRLVDALSERVYKLETKRKR
jgi:ribosomal protein L19E